MQIIFSEHARKRMEERDISYIQVHSALVQPDKVEVDKTNSNRFVAKKVYVINKAGRRHLLLVFYEVRPRRNRIEVITVVGTSKISKYF